MQIKGPGFYEVGPALLYDRALTDELSRHDFKQFIVNDGWAEDAKARRCVYFLCDGQRQFEANVEILVEEPAPAHTSFAKERVQGVGLDVPSGKLILDGACKLVGDPASAGDEEPAIASFEVPPGSYAVDLYGYMSHELRVQLDGAPGAPPMSTRWRWMQRVPILCTLITLVGILFIIAAVKTDSIALAFKTAAALVGIWVAYVVAYRLSGARAEDLAARAFAEKYIATLPPIPDVTIVLRRVELPPAEGGGIAF